MDAELKLSPLNVAQPFGFGGPAKPAYSLFPLVMPVYLEGPVLHLPDSGLRLATCSFGAPSLARGTVALTHAEKGERGTRR